MVPSFVWAQDVVEPSKAQLRLNNQGVEAMTDGKLDAAVEYFQSSLKLGPSNLGYLNLGRALSKVGRCSEARVAFDQVATAPIVRVPTPDEVRDVRTAYEADLEALCPRVELICSPASMQVVVDGGEPQPCTTPLDLDVGPHQLVGWVDDVSTAQDLELAAGDRKSITLTLVPVAEPLEPVQPAPSGPSVLSLAGWIVLGVGAASAATGLVIDLAVLGPDIESLEANPTDAELRSSLESNQDVVLGLVLGGSTMALAGAAMLIIDALGAGEESTTDAGTVWLSPNGGVGWQITW